MALPLKYFVRRTQTIELYRNYLRVVSKAPVESRAEIRAEVRRQFEINGKRSDAIDDYQHSFLLSQGRQRLIELEQMLHLSGAVTSSK